MLLLKVDTLVGLARLLRELIFPEKGTRDLTGREALLIAIGLSFTESWLNLIWLILRCSS